MRTAAHATQYPGFAYTCLRWSIKKRTLAGTLRCCLERVTNISMGTEIDKVMEFEELALKPEDAPSAVGLLD